MAFNSRQQIARGVISTGARHERSGEILSLRASRHDNGKISRLRCVPSAALRTPHSAPLEMTPFYAHSQKPTPKRNLPRPHAIVMR